MRGVEAQGVPRSFARFTREGTHAPGHNALLGLTLKFIPGGGTEKVPSFALSKPQVATERGATIRSMFSSFNCKFTTNLWGPMGLKKAVIIQKEELLVEGPLCQVMLQTTNIYVDH